jgi:hypothetical protein
MDDYIERLNRIADRYELPKKLNYDTEKSRLKAYTSYSFMLMSSIKISPSSTS